jgi:hypothetical protein
MCLSVSRLFWVSSLAYLNLLGTKGYVVVSTDLGSMKCASYVMPSGHVFLVTGNHVPKRRQRASADFGIGSISILRKETAST